MQHQQKILTSNYPYLSFSHFLYSLSSLSSFLFSLSISLSISLHHPFSPLLRISSCSSLLFAIPLLTLFLLVLQRWICLQSSIQWMARIILFQFLMKSQLQTLWNSLVLWIVTLCCSLPEGNQKNRKKKDKKKMKRKGDQKEENKGMLFNNNSIKRAIFSAVDKRDYEASIVNTGDNPISITVYKEVFFLLLCLYRCFLLCCCLFVVFVLWFCYHVLFWCWCVALLCYCYFFIVFY